jgi:Na+/H+ antiporter
MEHMEIILILLAVIACLAPLADKIKIPFPVVLVTVGLLIGFIPGIPPLKLAPDVVFLIFLPPLLYEAAFNTSWHDLKKERRTILFLSVRMVFFTMAILAVIIHYSMPGFTWPLAFLLGAILSPPDAVAATAATKGLKVPRKWITIIEGESLLNDSSALIAYRYAIIAVAGGTLMQGHTHPQTSVHFLQGILHFGWNYLYLWLDFMRVTIGGVAVGLGIGYGFYRVQRRLAGNAATEICLTLLVTYVAYLVAENLHTSGVLAVVTTGLFISWRSFRIFSSGTRLQMRIFWQVLIFLLNGFVFILIGLQLPSIQAGIGRDHLPGMIGYGLLISITAILIRPVFFIPASYINLRPGKKLTKERLRNRLNEAIVVSWSGMRGVVSLATALALPLTLSDGRNFPQRDTILFITFIVILVTLVLQGLTFPYIVRKLGLADQEDDKLAEERKLRAEMIQLSLDYIDQTLVSEVDRHVQEGLRQEYTERLRFLNGTANGEEPTEPVSTKRLEVRQNLDAQLKILQHQRKHIIQMHNLGSYSDEILHKMEQELDFWHLRLNARMQSSQLNIL